jgi:serpin B
MGVNSLVPRRGRARAVAAFLATVIVAGACGGSVATSAGTGGPTLAASPTSSAAWTPPPFTPSPTVIKPGDFKIAMGKAALSAPAEDNGAAAAASINAFGFDLLRRLDSQGNLCASPTSIALALAMTRAGARGQTATEMDAVLRSLGSDGNGGEIVALLASLQADTIYDDWYPDDLLATPDPGTQIPVELDVSNAVFSQNGMTLKPDYLDALSSGFAAGVGLLDFAADPEAARLVINKWASDRTKGRIPEVLQPDDINALTRIALANAIYLKAAWDSPFDETVTASKPFTLAGGSIVSVPTMAIDEQFSYAAGSGWKAIDLPYTTGGMAMTVIVPDDMASFTAGLTAAKFQSILGQEGNYDVDLTLPRFSAETRTDLAAVLKAMGMPTLFTPDADLSGITQDEHLYIGKVIHQANIDVVEQGTTAAAVTVVTGMTMGPGDDTTPSPPPHVKFHVDKPFLYFIHDTASGAVLFMGRIDNPSVGY